MTASPLIIPVARFFTVSGGAGLADGYVYTYAAGTDTLKDTYTDASGNTPNTNPVRLDSTGSAAIWLNGNYKINVLDSNEVQQPNYPVDNVSGSAGGSASEYVVTTGSANTYVITPSPAITAYSAGTLFNIKINATNTGPSTINISNLGAQALVISPSIAMTGGELLLNSIYTIIYDGTNFQVFGAPRQPVNAQTGTSYTFAAGDIGHLVTFSNASPIAASLPQANTSTFANGWSVTASNKNIGVVTITPTTSTINGASTYTLGANQSVKITSDGTNYQVSATGSSGLPNGGFATGRYYNGLLGLGGSATSTLSADVMYFVPIVTPSSQVFDRIAFNVQTTGTATNARVGIYDMTNGLPSTLILDGGLVGVGTTGNKEATISQSLSAGVYAVGAVFNGSCELLDFANDIYIPYVMGAASPSSGSVNIFTGSLTFGALPSTFPSATRAAGPRTMFYLRSI